MAMIPCPECGNTISDRVSKCPHCGYPMDSKKSRYSQFYEKPRPQTFQIEPQHEEREERQSKQGSSKSTALSISAMVISFMGLLTSFIAITIASGKPKEVYVEKEVPVYLEADQPQEEPYTEEPEIKEEVIPEEIEEEEPEVQVLEEEEPEEEKPVEDNTKEEKKTDNIFYVGDVLETKRIKLSYISCGSYTDDNMFVEAGENNELIYFEFEFENIGSTDASVGYYDFDCYADGYEAKNSVCTADNAMSSITTLSPGRRMGGIVVFEVPKNSQNIEVEYETSFWTQDKAIFMYR